jgi:hypothetical protein
MRGGIARVTAGAGARCIAALVFALCIAAPAAAQTCTFNANQPNTASFGAIDPSLVVTKTFSITINYKCTGGATASFTLTGANDTGPGAYQLQNQIQATQYMAYTVSMVNVPGTKITLNGQLVAANYQNAYVGNYADTLNLVMLP